MNDANWIALGSLVVALLGLLSGAFVYFQNRINALIDRAAEDLNGIREDFDKEMERVQNQESNARERLARETQAGITGIVQDFRQMRDSAGTKAEMIAMENRINASISKIETRIDKIEAKLEPLPAIHSMVTQLGANVERLGVVIFKRPPL
jgi:predicted  nucleic acid-binding Zn-ribbon protein